MKLPITKETAARATAALLRNCLTRHHVPRACPVRKCRRDGLCSGPLFTQAEGGGCRLARPDAADVAPGRNAAPICYMHIPKPKRGRVDKAIGAAVRAAVATPGLTIAEATRAISARRWRRLTGLEG